MTEKEKMLAGMYYNAADLQLVEERLRAKQLCTKFNQLVPSENDNRVEILRELFNTEECPYIEPHFYCDYGYNIIIGKNFYANHNCTILDVATVTIGDNIMFGPGVQVFAATHPVDAKMRISGLEMGKPVVIGDNTWIGGGSIICPGVTIGKNVVIGAGSVVTRDIPDNVVGVGNPCRVIKTLE